MPTPPDASRSIHARGLTRDGLVRVRACLNGRLCRRYEWHLPGMPRVGAVMPRRNGDTILIEALTLDEDGVWVLHLRTLARA